jgi:hypothetical protein
LRFPPMDARRTPKAQRSFQRAAALAG